MNKSTKLVVKVKRFKSGAMIIETNRLLKTSEDITKFLNKMGIHYAGHTIK